MWVKFILFFKNLNFEIIIRIKVQMNYKNIYIYEGRQFVCFVPMVHETKVIMTQGKLLNLKFVFLEK
jgi:hypothetical protein